MAERRINLKLRKRPKEIIDNHVSKNQRTKFINEAIEFYYRYGNSEDLEVTKEQKIINELENISGALQSFPELVESLKKLADSDVQLTGKQKKAEDGEGEGNSQVQSLLNNID